MRPSPLRHHDYGSGRAPTHDKPEVCPARMRHICEQVRTCACALRLHHLRSSHSATRSAATKPDQGRLGPFCDVQSAHIVATRLETGVVRNDRQLRIQRGHDREALRDRIAKIALRGAALKSSNGRTAMIGGPVAVPQLYDMDARRTQAPRHPAG